MMKIALISIGILLVSTTLHAQFNDSGGVLMYEQAAYRVHFYDLSIQLFPENKSIAGTLVMHGHMVHPSRYVVLDLEDRLQVAHTGNFDFNHTNGRIRIDLGRTHQPGESIAVPVAYSGIPREAPNPPWDGGFTWETTSGGAPWIGVTCQIHGADIWWPVKDHPSDRPDSMRIHIRVPDPLVAASNGRFQGSESHQDGTTTWEWFVSTPINNYAVSLNVAPYITIENVYSSIAGDEVPVTFWVLPEEEERGRRLFPQFAEHLRFYEELLGPYPFRADKYGVVHTPYLGMEHQTIIAYGAGFKNDVLFNAGAGYDDLHHHELGHEWWGNMVTVYDWRDFWIHEGLCTYMQALYTEKMAGTERYHTVMRQMKQRVMNTLPLAPVDSKTSHEMYRNRDVYFKGASVLHTLRYLVGDDHFFTILRRFSYPDELDEFTRDGSASRFANTDDFRNLSEEISGMNLQWFFDVYFRHASLPVLEVIHERREVRYRWVVPDEMNFRMPVDVSVNGTIQRLDGGTDFRTLEVPRNARVEFDPMQWILKSSR